MFDYWACASFRTLLFANDEWKDSWDSFLENIPRSATDSFKAKWN